MTTSTAAATRTHHSAAPHPARLNDKGQALPDDGTPFAQLLANGQDDTAPDDSQATTATVSGKGLQTLSDTTTAKQRGTPDDATPDATLAAWINQALGQHGANAKTPADTDASAGAGSDSALSSKLAALTDGAASGATSADQGLDSGDKSGDASTQSGNHAVKHRLPNLAAGTGAVNAKLRDSLQSVAQGHALAAKAAAADTTTATAPTTPAAMGQDVSNASAAAAIIPAGTVGSNNSAPASAAQPDSTAPFTVVAAPQDKGGAQTQANTGGDGGAGQQAFSGASNATAASSSATGSSSGSANAPSFTQAMQQAFDNLGAQVSFWSNNAVQRASMDLDTGSGGPLKVDVTLHEGKVHLDFKTDDATTRDALNQNATAVLSDLLSRNGIDLGGVSVGAQNSGQQNASADGGAAAGNWNGLARALNAASGGTAEPSGARQLVRSDRALDLYA